MKTRTLGKDGLKVSAIGLGCWRRNRGLSPFPARNALSVSRKTSAAQIKRVIDRFYAINGQIKGAPKKAAFLMTYANTSRKEVEPMLVHYHTLMDYLGWTSVGEVVALGVWTAGSVRNTDYPQQAYQLGKSL